MTAQYYLVGNNPSTGPVLTGNQGKKGGADLDEILTTSGAALDTINKVLCTINPKRPGCQINETTIIQEQRRNTWLLLAMLAVIAVLLIVVIRRKK